MANKKSFILYSDQQQVFNALSDEQAGKLIKHIYRFIGGDEKEPEDFIVNIAFIPIRTALERDIEKWETQVGERSGAGVKGNLKRWHPELYAMVESGDIALSGAVEIAKHRKASLSDNSNRYPSQSIANIADNVNDNVSVSVNDSVNDSVNVTEKEKSTSLEVLKNEKEIELQHPLNEYIFNAESDFAKLKKIFKPMKNAECEKVIERAKELMPVGDHYRSVIVRALEKMDGSKSVDKKSSLYRTLLNYLVYAKAEIVADMSADNRLEKMKGVA